MAEISQKMQDALRREYAENATDEQFNLWIGKCEREDLVPVEDVVLQIRSVSEWDPETRAKVKRKRPIYITTARALVKIASRTGKYQGKLPTEWIYLDENNRPTIISTIPLADSADPTQPARPWAARVPVRHKDFPDPVIEPVRFEAYAQTVTRDNQTFLNSTWATRGPEQLAKCAFAASLRVCFPEAGGLYLAEELDREDNHSEPAPATPATSVALPTLSVAPAAVVVQTAPVQQPPKENVNLTQTVETLKEFVQNPDVQATLAAQGKTVDHEAVAALENDLAAALDEAVAAIGDPVPTKEANKANLEKLRTYKVDRESMRLYLQSAHGVEDTKSLNKTFTVGQWKKLFAALDAAVSSNTLEALVKGEPKDNA
jgi:hypothetical protein